MRFDSYQSGVHVLLGPPFSNVEHISISRLNTTFRYVTDTDRKVAGGRKSLFLLVLPDNYQVRRKRTVSALKWMKIESK